MRAIFRGCVLLALGISMLPVLAADPNVESVDESGTKAPGEHHQPPPATAYAEPVDETVTTEQLLRRIEELEKRLLELESRIAPKSTQSYTVPRAHPPSPFGSPRQQPTPQYSEPQPVPHTQPAPNPHTMPDNWQRFEFNGDYFYIIPVDEFD